MRDSLLVLFITLTYLVSAQTTIINTGSSWKYNDSGSDLGTAWRTSSYSDASWSSGNAILGYGTINAGSISTTLSYGPSSSNKYPTYYFRKSFNYVPTGSETYYKFEVLVDDGALFYLNGTEIESINMPSGTITYSTYASAVGDEDNYRTFIIPVSAMQSGSNVLAVEVHQRSGSSSDIGFDLSLEAHFDLNIRFIHFGSTNNPLNGLRVTWRDETGVDSIKWGYTTAYSEGEFKAESRELYEDSLYEYAFPVITPNSTIHYSIYSASFNAWSQDMTFQTSTDTSSNHFKFISFGDCRTYLNDWQKISSLVPDADFTLFNGDIINNGDVAGDWDDWFDYGEDFISSHLVYHTFGNHEDNGMGNATYSNLYVLPENPSGSDKYYSFEFGNAVFICLDSQSPSNTTQYNWLINTLTDNSDKTWKFVWFHKPFYTSPSHTTDMHSYWNTWWKAFDDYGVDVVFNGHTHNYQRTKPINRNVSTTAEVDHYGSCPLSGRLQIVTGRAGAPAVGAGTGWFIQTSSAELNYGVIEIDENTFTFVARDSSNSVIDSLTISKDFDSQISSTPEGPVGSGNGTATASGEGGYSPYTYLWNTGATTASITNLDSGWYYVTITDDVECELYDSVYVDTTSAVQYLTTTAATSITTTTATLNADIKPPSGGFIFGLEFELGTTTSYNNIVSSNPNYTNTNSSVTGAASGLSPSTLYHYRIKGTDGSTTYYGADETFTTAAATAPTVVMGAPFTNISSAAAENTNNEVTSDGGSAVTERGMVYATSPNPSISDNKKNSSGQIGQYDIALLGLSSATTYYARAFASNNVGTSYSLVSESFTTESGNQAIIDSVVLDTDPQYVVVYFTPGDGQGTMIICREDNDISQYPADGVSASTYNYSAIYGDGYDLGEGNYVVYRGDHSKGDITIGGLDGTKEYYFAAVEYSGSSSETNYRTSDASKGNTLGTPLPIQLVDFRVRNIDSAVAITWATASERNNEHFEIEKSTNGEHFVKILETKSLAGNSNTLMKYIVYDKNPSSGISYYRLKQVDFDGKYSYSDIQVLNRVDKNTTGLSRIRCNENVIAFVYNSDNNQSSELQLIDASGKIIFSTSISGIGARVASIPRTSISNGLYILRLINNKQEKNYKIIVN